MFNAETNEYREIKVYFRSVLKPGASVSGAALVRDRGTTIMIPDGYAGKVADDHSLIIEINKKPDD
jgi:N-methylhydantoinase A/oxoprolinase/acetone carboxylase beta subunit